ITSHRVQPAAAARQCQSHPLAVPQRPAFCRRAGLQMARIAQAFRPLAHYLYPHESLVQERRARSRLRALATRADCAHQNRGRQNGLHHREGACPWHRRFKKNGPQAIGKSRGGWTTKIHMVAADARTAIIFALSPGEARDAKAGRALLGGLGPLPAPLHLIMDRAYEDGETRPLALEIGFIPVVPPKNNRLEPWQYDRAMYRKRNEVERLFRRLKGFRRIFSRFEKLDVLFLGFLTFTLIVEALR